MKRFIPFIDKAPKELPKWAERVITVILGIIAAFVMVYH